MVVRVSHGDCDVPATHPCQATTVEHSGRIYREVPRLPNLVARTYCSPGETDTVHAGGGGCCTNIGGDLHQVGATLGEHTAQEDGVVHVVRIIPLIRPRRPLARHVEPDRGRGRWNSVVPRRPARIEDNPQRRGRNLTLLVILAEELILLAEEVAIVLVPPVIQRVSVDMVRERVRRLNQLQGHLRIRELYRVHQQLHLDTLVTPVLDGALLPHAQNSGVTAVREYPDERRGKRAANLRRVAHLSVHTVERLRAGGHSLRHRVVAVRHGQAGDL